MPVLTNSKHEKFAQARARGLTADEAYVQAGFAQSRSNASRLSANESVIARVAELQQQGAAKAGWTVGRVVDALVDLSIKAVEAKQFGPATRAIELVGRTIGCFVDKATVTLEGEMVDAVLVKKIARGDARLEAALMESFKADGFESEADSDATRH